MIQTFFFRRLSGKAKNIFEKKLNRQLTNQKKKKNRLITYKLNYIRLK